MTNPENFQPESAPQIEKCIEPVKETPDPKDIEGYSISLYLECFHELKDLLEKYEKELPEFEKLEYDEDKIGRGAEYQGFRQRHARALTPLLKFLKEIIAKTDGKSIKSQNCNELATDFDLKVNYWVLLGVDGQIPNYIDLFVECAKDKLDGFIAAPTGGILPELMLKGILDGFNSELEKQGVTKRLKEPYFSYAHSKAFRFKSNNEEDPSKEYKELLLITEKTLKNIIETLPEGEETLRVGYFDESYSQGRTIRALKDLIWDAFSKLQSGDKLYGKYHLETFRMPITHLTSKYPYFYRPFKIEPGSHLLKRVSKDDGDLYLKQERLFFELVQIFGHYKGRLFSNIALNGESKDVKKNLINYTRERFGGDAMNSFIEVAKNVRTD